MAPKQPQQAPDHDHATEDDFSQQVMGLKDAEPFDNNGLFIIHEAHLISRSLNQTELLRFGSGRLLADFMAFIELQNTQRKIIFIGDPYLISFGKPEDSALNIETLTELFPGPIIRYKASNKGQDAAGKEKMRFDLAQALDEHLYNHLEYLWQEPHFLQGQTPEVEGLLHQWFPAPIKDEPDRAVLVYKRTDARKINLWIKKHCLTNGSTLATGDLMLLNNNINIIDGLGLSAPAKIFNGTYLTITAVNAPRHETFTINNREVRLVFRNITAKVLGMEGSPAVSLSLLENYLESDSGLTKDETLAFRILISRKLAFMKVQHPFSQSTEADAMRQTAEYKGLSAEQVASLEYLAGNYSLPKEQKKDVKTTQEVRSIIAGHYRKYDARLLRGLREADPQINAAFVSYGWAITVHKAVGSSFSNVILNAHQNETGGINNGSYFRWLYSGFTSAMTSCLVINPQELSPIQHCEFEDTTEVRSILPGQALPSLIKYQGYSPSANHKIILGDLSNDNVIGAICEVADRAITSGFILCEALPKSPYLTRVTFIHRDNQGRKLVLDIDNKGERDDYAVSGIRIHSAEDGDRPLVQQLLERALSSAADFRILPDDYRRPIYERWEAELIKSNLTMKIIASHNNHDIFTATDNSRLIKFKVWYGTSERENTKGYINKIVVMEKSHAELGQQLKALLL